MKTEEDNQEYTEVFVFGGNKFPNPKTCSFNIVIHQISCGDIFSAFIASNGYIYSMGSNSDGRLGIGQKSIKSSSSPTLVEGLSRYNAIKISCGYGHSLALMENGEVFSWGLNDEGQLGIGSFESSYTPQLITLGQPRESIQAMEIMSGTNHSFIISGDCYCFGSDETGQLGLGKRINTAIPTIISTIQEKIISTAGGKYHSLFLTENGRVYASGGNFHGQLGIGNKKNSTIPIRILALETQNIQMLAVSFFASCGLTTNGDLYIWGTGSFGETLFPQKIKSISMGKDQICVIDLKGQLFTWGSNNQGELGTGDFEPRKVPTLVKSLQSKNVTAISCGGEFVLALGKKCIKSTQKNPVEKLNGKHKRGFSYANICQNNDVYNTFYIYMSCLLYKTIFFLNCFR